MNEQTYASMLAAQIANTMIQRMQVSGDSEYSFVLSSHVIKADLSRERLHFQTVQNVAEWLKQFNVHAVADSNSNSISIYVHSVFNLPLTLVQRTQANHNLNIFNNYNPGAADRVINP